MQHQNDELATARGAAEAASEAKDNFLAALSHELRTPLTPVLMSVELLRTSPNLPADVQQLLQVVWRNVELEARLIDDLLDLTRIVRGKIDFKPTTCDVHAIISNAIEICRTDIDR